MCGNGPTRDSDLREVAAAIHQAQNWVRAQASARLHPGEFRLMGEVIGSRPEREGSVT